MICSKESALIYPTDTGIQFMKELLKPKLICLVDDYEKELVVTGGLRESILQFKEVRNF
jgi:hypothetical protein